MGVLTDFVVTDRQNAHAVCDSACPSRDFDGLDAKGIDTVKLSTLYAILTGAPVDPAFVGDDSLLCSGGEEGPWVIEVPQDLVQRLAKLEAKQVGDVAAQWAQTDEFSPAADNWPEEDVREVLRRLAELCRQAVAEGKAVLMWMSL